MPMRFSRPSTTPHGEKPMQTISDLAFGDLAKRASPTCLTTPNDNGKTFFFFHLSNIIFPVTLLTSVRYNPSARCFSRSKESFL